MGELARTDAASAAVQSASDASTTARGRVSAVSPGYTVRATAAASSATSTPPRRVVLRVDRLTAPCWATGASLLKDPSGDWRWEALLPHAETPTQLARASAASRRGPRAADMEAQ